MRAGYKNVSETHSSGSDGGRRVRWEQATVDVVGGVGVVGTMKAIEHLCVCTICVCTAYIICVWVQQMCVYSIRTRAGTSTVN